MSLYVCTIGSIRVKINCHWIVPLNCHGNIKRLIGKRKGPMCWCSVIFLSSFLNDQMQVSFVKSYFWTTWGSLYRRTLEISVRPYVVTIICRFAIYMKKSTYNLRHTCKCIAYSSSYTNGQHTCKTIQNYKYRVLTNLHGFIQRESGSPFCFPPLLSLSPPQTSMLPGLSYIEGQLLPLVQLPIIFKHLPWPV